MSYQKITIAGNLGREPEMRYMPDGTAVTNLNVATNRSWSNADGERVHKPPGSAFRCGANAPKSPTSTCPKATRCSSKGVCRQTAQLAAHVCGNVRMAP